LDETIWSLTSPLVKRISGSKKFRSSPQKDFCNNIGAKRTSATIANSLNERLWNGRFRRKMAARELGTLNSFQEKS
jgi:hypothetical protein